MKENLKFRPANTLMGSKNTPIFDYNLDRTFSSIMNLNEIQSLWDNVQVIDKFHSWFVCFDYFDKIANKVAFNNKVTAFNFKHRSFQPDHQLEKTKRWLNFAYSKQFKPASLPDDDFSKYEVLLDPPKDWVETVFFSPLKGLMTIETIKVEIQKFVDYDLKTQSQILSLIKSTFRKIKNTINNLLSKISRSTDAGLYQLEPIIRAVFHYMVNIFAIERVDELESGVACSSFSFSSNFRPWQRSPFLKSFLTSRI